MATDDKKKTDTTKVPRTRSASKPKSRGQILGGIIDQFEAMDHTVRREVLDFLRTRYPSGNHVSEKSEVVQTYGA